MKNLVRNKFIISCRSTLILVLNDTFEFTIKIKRIQNFTDEKCIQIDFYHK
jgi:hypothetical protein